MNAQPTPRQAGILRALIAGRHHDLFGVRHATEEHNLGEVTAKLVQGAGSDRHNAVEWANVVVPFHELETYLAWLDVRAAGLVDQGWPQIEALATLLERQRLGGTEARRIIRESIAQAMPNRRAAT
jgi:hypothetical protein